MGGVETTVLHLFFYASPQYPFSPLFISSEFEEYSACILIIKFQVSSSKFKVKSSK